MKLSRKSEYALRAVRHCSRQVKGKLSTIRAISEDEGVPREFLARIVRELSEAGILISTRGIKGGFRLARAPKDTTYLDVIEATQGRPFRLALPVKPTGSALSRFWQSQEKQWRKALKAQHFGKARKPRK